jgi:hypothetical protein
VKGPIWTSRRNSKATDNKVVRGLITYLRKGKGKI